VFCYYKKTQLYSSDLDIHTDDEISSDGNDHQLQEKTMLQIATCVYNMIIEMHC